MRRVALGLVTATLLCALTGCAEAKAAIVDGGSAITHDSAQQLTGANELRLRNQIQTAMHDELVNDSALDARVVTAQASAHSAAGIAVAGAACSLAVQVTLDPPSSASDAFGQIADAANAQNEFGEMYVDAKQISDDLASLSNGDPKTAEVNAEIVAFQYLYCEAE